MPKYTFDCTCGLQFTRTLKIGNHQNHICPSCGGEAPRKLDRFDFKFGSTAGAAPGNTGVAKDDYPTADHIVGRDAEGRWDEIRARDQVKEKVREVGGSHALIRHSGEGYVEYEAGSPQLIEGRKQLAKKLEGAVTAPPKTLKQLMKEAEQS